MEVRSIAWVASIAIIAAACSSPSSSSSSPAPVVVACDSTASTTATDTFAISDVSISLDSGDPLLAPVRADLASYLGAMWGGAVGVASSSPDGSRKVEIWLSTSARAGG